MAHPSTNHPPPETRWLGRWFTAARRDGLLALLSPEVWHTLSTILSFTSRDGSRSFTLDQLAQAMGQPREEAAARLAQLTEARWRDRPLATLVRDPDGEICGATLADIEALAQLAPTSPNSPVSPASGSNPELAAALLAVGLEPAQVEWLIGTFTTDLIQRQLDFLPARQARNPAALLLRAIEHDWDPPREGL